MSLVIDGVRYEDGLNSDEQSHLRATVYRWEQNPDIPKVVLIGSDPSLHAIPGKPAFEISGRNGIEIVSTKHLLEVFKFPRELHETAARVNVYPATVPRDEASRYVADDNCSDGVVPFVASRMAAIFGALPPMANVWVAALGVVANLAVRRHLGMHLGYPPRVSRYFGRIKPKLVITRHPRRPKEELELCADEFGKWLNGGLKDANQEYVKRLQVEQELRAAQEELTTVRIRDTIKLRYLDEDRTITVKLVHNEDDRIPDKIGVGRPFGKLLYGAKAKQELQFLEGKRDLAFVIDEIIKPSATETA